MRACWNRTEYTRRFTDINSRSKQQMKIEDILARVDHTLLSRTAVWEQIREMCDDGIKYGTASVCIPPCYVEQAARYMRQIGRAVPICTVIGFPNGYSTAAVKVYEASEALESGADEIDMVINTCILRAGGFSTVEDEIRAVKCTCGKSILKVIIETCLLTEAEKIKMCEITAAAGADFIKTSTGFAGGGATFEDVALLRKYSPRELRVKAAGGIQSIADAEKFIELGADRLGTSRIVAEVKSAETAAR